jgi:hypothetical protein
VLITQKDLLIKLQGKRDYSVNLEADGRLE